MNAFCRMENGTAVALDNIPEHAIERFSELIVQYTQTEGARLIALFILPESRPVSEKTPLRLIAILSAKGKNLGVLRSEPLSKPAYPAITRLCKQAHFFECEIAEQWGITPEGHPWLFPLRFQKPDLFHPAAIDPFGRHPDTPVKAGEKHFREFRNEDLHELGLGPIHARLNAPTHYRFQICGDMVYTMEPSLGYLCRRIEDRFIGGPHPDTLHLLESISGDNVMAHTIAGVGVFEALGNVETSERGQAIRGVLLELERIRGHLGVSVRMADSISALQMVARCKEIRSAVMDLTGQFCGNRQGRNVICPGGVADDISETVLGAVGFKLGKAASDYDQAVMQFLNTPTATRKLSCGTVTSEFCRDYGVAGLTARASGVPWDVRVDHPLGLYQQHPYITITEERGDSRARFLLRRREVQASVSYIIDTLISLPDDPHSAFDDLCHPNQLPLTPNALAIAMTEGVGGPCTHIGITDHRGHLLQYKIATPAMSNFAAVSQAVSQSTIAAFPLICDSIDPDAADHDL